MDLDSSIQTPLALNRASNYENLQFEGDKKITYQNTGIMTAKIVVLCLSPFYFGYCLTYLSTFSKDTLETVYGSQSIKSTVNAVLIGIVPVGAIIGAGIAPFLMKLFTRKRFILFINLLAIIVEGVIQYNNIICLLVCRGLQGIFIGNYMAIVPIYINEMVPKQIVGSFGVFTQLFVVIALVVSYGIGLILDALNAAPFVFYRIMVGLNAITIIVQSILLIVNYVPESPNSLIAKNRIEEAREVIAQFTVPQYVDSILNQKILEVEVENAPAIANKNVKAQQKIKYACRAFLLGFELPFMQQLTGINAIVTEAGSIVSPSSSSGQQTTLGLYTPIIINAVQLLATISCVFVLSRVGRKALTLFGNLGLAICDFIIAVLFIFISWEPARIIIVVMLIIYMIIYGISIGPSVWLYVPEIIPAKIVPLATMMNWLGCSLCVIFTPIAIAANDGNAYPVFFFYGGITTLFFIINVFLMEETKGLTVEQIAKKFNKESID